MSLEIELDQKPVEFGDSSQNQPDFGELYDQYFHRLYAYLCYRLNSKQDAEDLVAETFLHAMRGIASFQQLHSHSFAAWLFRIAHNLLVSFHRQRRRWQDWLPLEEAEVVPAPSTQSPEEVLIKQEQSRELGRLLDSLAPRHKEVITLKYFGELRNQEIATILGLDERTVAAYLHRGLQELQRRYHLEHSSALPSGTLLPGRITPPASFSPILPQGGIMNSKQPQFWLAQPGNLTNLNYTPPRPYPMGQPGWAVGIEVGESLGSEEFSSDWLELLGLISYLKRVVPQADETLRLRLKGYLLAQLQHQPKPVPLNSRC